jgi:hypothetical protein
MSDAMDHRKLHRIIYILVDQGEHELAHVVTMLYKDAKREHSDNVLFQSDRDNRARRMQIAHIILDESACFDIDLDKIAEIIWPNPIADEFSEIPDPLHLLHTQSRPAYNTPNGESSLEHVRADQLPPDMRHCTIVCKSCEQGHSWLTATNWLDFPCPQCEIERLRKSLRVVPVEWKWCAHSGCAYLADPGLENGYCMRHFHEGQPVATVDISAPTPPPVLCGFSWNHDHGQGCHDQTTCILLRNHEGCHTDDRGLHPEICGYKEQLGSRLWTCTRPKGHSDHHHLDDGVDIECGKEYPLMNDPRDASHFGRCALPSGHSGPCGYDGYSTAVRMQEASDGQLQSHRAEDICHKVATKENPTAPHVWVTQSEDDCSENQTCQCGAWRHLPKPR